MCLNINKKNKLKIKMAKILTTIFFEPMLLKDSKKISGCKYINDILSWYKTRLNNPVDRVKKIVEIHENGTYIYITFWVDYKKICYSSLCNPDPDGNYPLLIGNERYLVYATEFKILG